MAMRKYLCSLLCLSLLVHGASVQVFAEVDPAKLVEILSAIAGTGVVINTGSTGNTTTGTNSTNNPVDDNSDNSNFNNNPVNNNTTTTSPVGAMDPDGVEDSFASHEETGPVMTQPVVNTPLNSAPSYTLPSFKILRVETGDRKATFTFIVANETADIKKFEFLYADEEGNTNKVRTFEKERIRKANGNYVWYIPNLALTKYTVSIAGVGADGETIPGVISKPFEANLSLSAAGKCVIPNVSGLRVLNKKDTSVLYWDAIPEAVKYKVYKKNNKGEYMFVHETKKDSYTIYVANGAVKYEEFSVKAVCSDGTESLKFSPSTSVRTGPAMLIILALISGFIAWIIMRKRKKMLGNF